MKQKVIKVGNSYAVTIPKSFVKEVSLEAGYSVQVEADAKKEEIRLDFSSDTPVNEVVDPEVYKVAKDLMKRYLPAFKELSKR